MPAPQFPRIAVVGAGALGSYFGGMLARAGAGVVLIGRRPHVEAITRSGLLIESGGTAERVRLDATTEMAAVRDARLVLFCVKSNDTGRTAADMAPQLAHDAAVVSMQNGVDNVERIREHVPNTVLCALVYTGAHIPAPGQVRHTGGGGLVIGELGASRNRGLLAEVAGLFAAAGVPARITESTETELWTKLVLNCAYNAICALTGANYGQMVAAREIRAVMAEAVDEVVRLAAAKHVRLPSDMTEITMKLADAMPHTLSSTAQDIAKGRPTEIDHLNGYVAREAAALGLAAPVNATLNALVKLVERTKGRTAALRRDADAGLR